MGSTTPDYQSQSITSLFGKNGTSLKKAIIYLLKLLLGIKPVPKLSWDRRLLDPETFAL